MSKIVKMSRNRGDLLTRMNNKKYVRTNFRSAAEATIVAQEKRALFFKRVGRDYNVRDNYAPSDVFTDFSVYQIPAENISQSAENYEQTVKNQNQIEVGKINDNLYIIEADFADMVKYTSTDPVQAELGKFYWGGLVIETGEDSIIGSKFDGYAFTQSDVDEADSVKAPKGSFILWLKLEWGNRTFILESAEGKETAITLKVVNTDVVDITPPAMHSASVYFEDDMYVDFIGNTVEVLQGSVATDINVILNKSVQLSGEPKAMYVVEGGEDVEYGTIEIDEMNPFGIIIKPIGDMGESTTLGVHTIRIPADSVRHKGIGNKEVFIEVTVVETPAIRVVGATAHFTEGPSIHAVDNVFTFDEGRVVTAIDLVFANYITVKNTPVVQFTVGGSSVDFGTVVTHNTSRSVARILPTGGEIEFAEALEGTLSIPANAVEHREVKSVAMEYGVVVESTEV